MSRKLVKHVGKTPDFFSVVYEDEGMKSCTQVPRTCMDKHLVLNFHLFAESANETNFFILSYEGA